MQQRGSTPGGRHPARPARGRDHWPDWRWPLLRTARPGCRKRESRARAAGRVGQPGTPGQRLRPDPLVIPTDRHPRPDTSLLKALSLNDARDSAFLCQWPGSSSSLVTRAVTLKAPASTWSGTRSARQGELLRDEVSLLTGDPAKPPCSARPDHRLVDTRRPNDGDAELIRRLAATSLARATLCSDQQFTSRPPLVFVAQIAARGSVVGLPRAQVHDQIAICLHYQRIVKLGAAVCTGCPYRLRFV